jgi:hypothetical protein
MNNTLKVMTDRRHEIDALVAAGEVLDLRFQGNQTALGLRAAKLLHVLIGHAGADAGRIITHVVPLAALNEIHHRSKEELLADARELVGTTIRLETVNAKGRRTTVVGPLLGHVERDEDADGELRFELSTVLRQVMRSSNHWAVLSRRAVMAFQSRYSLRLYELISLRMGREHQHSEEYSIDDLRALLGVPSGKLTTWSNLRLKVLELAIAEVSHLTGVAVKYEPVKRGRAVTGVRLIWREKAQHARDAAAAELDRSSLGRAARRDGTAEQVVDGAEAMATAQDFRQLATMLGQSKRVPG